MLLLLLDIADKTQVLFIRTHYFVIIDNKKISIAIELKEGIFIGGYQ